MVPMVREITWNGAGCEIGGANFEVVSGDFNAHKSNAERLVILKGKGMIDRYVAYLSRSEPKRALEFGIYEGGSMALLSLLFGLEKFVGIDLRHSIPGFDAWRDAHPTLATALRPHFGVSQDDRARVKQIIASEFGDAPLDFVVDDASHFYEQSRATFETAFPHLRPGGLYILEDWGWAHWQGEWQDKKIWADKKPLTLLLFELTTLVASRPDLVSSVQIVDRAFAIITKGERTPREPFRLDDHIQSQGRTFGFQ